MPFSRPDELIRDVLAYGNVAADLIDELDSPQTGHWLGRFRSHARRDGAKRVLSLARRLEDALFALATTRDDTARVVRRLLAVLGDVELHLARSPRAREACPPVPSLSRHWLQQADDGSAEFALAAALAGLHARRPDGGRSHRGHLPEVAMVAIAFRFPAGRYHATPWGRHVNETEVECPPSPWRILRGLVATFHRKGYVDRHAVVEVDRLVERLADALPVYALPTAVRSHSRHYMPQGRFKGGREDTALVFDAFVRVEPDSELVVGWPVTLDAAQSALLRALVHDLDVKRLKKPQQRILHTLPETLAGALRNETGDLQAAGWSSPPGARFVTYQRPLDAFTARPGRRRATQSRAVTTVRLALAGGPLPRIEDAIRIGELVRMAAIKKAERVGEGGVPPVLSGHGLPADNRHGHAFYLPEDADGDGRIDHVLVHAADGLDATAEQALDRIARLWERDGGEWQVFLEGYGDVEDLADSPYLGGARQWRSVSPYLHPWHAKRRFRFGVTQQIARECRERGLPEPEVTPEEVPFEGIDGRRRHAVHFHRFRNTRKRMAQPDTRGRFLTLTFPEPVEGPLALGFGCHFGLGLFRPV